MNCTGCRYYHNLADNHCLVCDGSGYTRPSNADRIRAKSDEELAEWLETIVDCALCQLKGKDCKGGRVESRASCSHHWLDWLGQEEVEKNEDVF